MDSVKTKLRCFSLCY